MAYHTVKNLVNHFIDDCRGRIRVRLQPEDGSLTPPSHTDFISSSEEAERKPERLVLKLSRVSSHLSFLLLLNEIKVGPELPTWSRPSDSDSETDLLHSRRSDPSEQEAHRCAHSGEQLHL